MHGFLLTLTLAAFLLASISILQQKAGPGLDPDGLTAPAPTTDLGPGLNPSGRS